MGYQNTTLVVYGDMGISNSARTASRLIQLDNATNGGFDFVFHVGDMSYSDDYPSGMYEEVWNGWFEELSPVMHYKPYMVAPGNHEYSCEHLGCDYTQNFTAFNHRFMMPSELSNGTKNMWYSFDYSNIHFIVVSTETDFPGAPEGSNLFGDQINWLEYDLQKASENREEYPWIVVGGHRPIYCSAFGYSNIHGVPISDPANLQAAMEDLFYKYQVDLFLVGHVHAYERCFPTYNSVAVSTSYVNPSAPTYVITGTGGNTEGLSNPNGSNWNYPAPGWSAHRYGNGWGYGMLTISVDTQNQQHLANWRFYRALDEGLEDEFTIVKNFSKKKKYI